MSQKEIFQKNTVKKRGPYSGDNYEWGRVARGTMTYNLKWIANSRELERCL